MTSGNGETMFGRIRRIHFVGIGGAGMSGIAEVLLNRGFIVSGSDRSVSEVTERLKSLGATVQEDHAAEHVAHVDLVVYSSAVKLDNVELVEAEKRKIPVIRRAEMLGELMRMKYGIAIAGTHGKTTTTSMTALVVAEGGFDPTIIVGGKVNALGANAKVGEGDYIVVEADEFDRTFLQLTPTIAVITNLEREHLDTYRDIDDIKGAFVEFANKVPFFGAVILCLDEPGVQDIIPRLKRRLVSYGLTPQSDIQAVDLHATESSVRFTVEAGGVELGEIDLKVPGLHNVRNALAAIGVGLELGIGFDVIQRALEAFTGVQRRFEIRGTANGITVVDDYAHHPTEIMATLQAAKAGWRKRRVVAVFQPHLYSRTRDFHEEFGRSFLNADVLVVTDIYASREEPIQGITGELVAADASRFGHKDVHYVADKADLPAELLRLVRPGDMVITLGAGDVNRAGQKLLAELTAGAVPGGESGRQG